MQMLWFLMIPLMVVAIAIAVVPIVIMSRVESRGSDGGVRVAPENWSLNENDERERIPVGSGA